MQNEDRKCPLENCDSMGHLSGKLEKHFTIEACPMYHNRSVQACKVSVKMSVNIFYLFYDSDVLWWPRNPIYFLDHCLSYVYVCVT